MLVKRAISLDQLDKMKFDIMEFDGMFADSLGSQAQRSGSWIIYGDSGHGKTTFALQLAKYLTKFGTVMYNSMEEGARLSLKMALARQQFSAIEKRRFKIVSEEISVLRERLYKQKSPHIIFIDSFQFTELTKSQYKKFIAEFPTKLFIWLSHVDGKKPLGSAAEFVRYNSDLKLFVQGFKMIPEGRFEGQKDYVINDEKAADYWNDTL